MTDQHGYTILAARTPVRRAPDVARLRKALNSFGCDASYADIRLAWSDHSKVDFESEWTPLGRLSDRQLFEVLRERMEPDGGIGAGNRAIGDPS